MKPEHVKVILKAMPYIIKELEVDESFLSVFVSEGILDEHSVEEILVGVMANCLQIVISCGPYDSYLIPLVEGIVRDRICLVHDMTSQWVTISYLDLWNLSVLDYCKVMSWVWPNWYEKVISLDQTRFFYAH